MRAATRYPPMAPRRRRLVARCRACDRSGLPAPGARVRRRRAARRARLRARLRAALPRRRRADPRALRRRCSSARSRSSAIGKTLILELLGQHQQWWRYFRLPDLWPLFRALFVASVLMVLVFVLVKPYPDSLPRSVIDLRLHPLLRAARWRAPGATLDRRAPAAAPAARRARSVLVVGAGSGGQMVVRELQLNPNLGARRDRLRRRRPAQARDAHRRPQGARHDRRDRRDPRPARPRRGRDRDPVGAGRRCAARSSPRAASASIEVRTLPTVFELLRGGVQLTRQLREVQVEDVLGRDPVVMELDRVGAYLEDKRVLVTGAGGSIGSELVAPDRPRAAAPARPARPRRGQPVRDRPRDDRAVALHPGRVGARRLQRGRPDARGDAALQARGRLPRRRLQARRR